MPLKAVVLRYTLTSPDADAAVLEWIRNVAPAHLVVRHMADKDDANPHWHAHMYTEREVQSLRVALTKAVPSAKKRYGLKPVGATDEDHATNLRYLCHGDDETLVPVIVSAQSPVGVEAGWGTQAWANAQHKDFHARRKEFVRETKSGAKSLLEHCLLAASERDVRTLEDIIDLVMDAYKTERKSMDLRYMENIARTVWYHQNKPEAADHIKRSLMNRLQFIL